jgi:hypothetical protein
MIDRGIQTAPPTSPSCEHENIMPKQTHPSFFHGPQILISFYTKKQARIFHELGHLLGKKMPLVSILSNKVDFALRKNGTRKAHRRTVIGLKNVEDQSLSR